MHGLKQSGKPSQKYNMLNILLHKGRTICLNSLLLPNEEKYIKGALQRCTFSYWVLHRLKIKNNHKLNTNQQVSTWQYPTPKD